MKKWVKSNPVEIFRAKIFRYIKTDITTSTGLKTTFDIIQCANWVNIVAINASGEFILVSQYRVGSDSVTLETAAGAIEKEELPLDAAKRELKEETGYISKNWHDLGAVDVNPAFMTNKCFVFLALDCIQSGETCLDEFEEIELIHLTESALKKKLDSEIIHSLSLLSFLKFFYWQKQQAL